MVSASCRVSFLRIEELIWEAVLPYFDLSPQISIIQGIGNDGRPHRKVVMTGALTGWGNTSTRQLAALPADHTRT